jgi:hypothetical protein
LQRDGYAKQVTLTDVMNNNEKVNERKGGVIVTNRGEEARGLRNEE